MQVGDKVKVTGKYNPDKGWISTMRGYAGQAGYIVREYADGNFEVTFYDELTWVFHKSDLTKI